MQARAMREFSCSDNRLIAMSITQAHTELSKNITKTYTAWAKKKVEHSNISLDRLLL